MTLLLLALQIMVLAPPAGPAPVCRHQDGVIDGPVVPTAEVARGVFNAIAKPLQSDEVASRYVLTIVDADTTWGIYQALPTATDGGGGIEMRIDKCTGAVSALHYSK